VMQGFDAQWPRRISPSRAGPAWRLVMA
jgi:hypothetical protein